MLNKFFIIITLFFYNTVSYAAKAPSINCIWLPGCVDSNIKSPWSPSIGNNIWVMLISNIIWQMIQYVAVVAVISLIISGIMYMVSWWEEEKANKAKSWIIWSLVWVIVSISAWWIINMLNNIYLYN